MKSTAGMVVDHKKVLNQLAELALQEEDCVVNIYKDPEKIRAKKSNLEITRSKVREEFIVLIIGAFSSGKSSMINALIGEELLPTGILPETAVLGELHYGEKKRITLYPKKGMWEGGNEPFDLKETTSEEIAKYVSLTAEDAINTKEEEDGCVSKIDSKFEKMVIYWPLEMLKDGVVLVDSPGINDPYGHDYIVNDYLPYADAVIYLMNSLQGYNATDVEQLTQVNNIGFRNIITGYTYYDMVIKNNRRTPEKLEKTRTTLVEHMKKHSDLGADAVHFLDSLEGLDAKLDNDQEAFRHSGYEGFERYLGKYLVEGKGKDQVKNMASTIVKQAEVMIKDVENLNAAAAQDEKVLEKRINDSEMQLSIVRTNSFNTGRNYRLCLNNYIPGAEEMAHKFIKELPNKINLDGFEPQTQLPDGPRKLWPFGEGGARKRAKSIQDECQHEIERRMNAEYTRWANDTLGTYMKNAVTESAQQIRPDLEQIAKDLNGITNTITGVTGKTNDGTVGNIALGLAYAMLTGDWFTGSMGAIYGKGTMARGIAAQVGTGLALGVLFSLGAPITLPVVVVSAIGASILAILTDNNKKKVSKIKVQVVKSFKEYFDSSESEDENKKVITEVMEKVKSYINDACEDMDAALAEDIKGTEDNIKQMIQESKMSQDEKREQIDKRSSAVEKLKELQDKTIDICKKYNITDTTL